MSQWNIMPHDATVVSADCSCSYLFSSYASSQIVTLISSVLILISMNRCGSGSSGEYVSRVGPRSSGTTRPFDSIKGETSITSCYHHSDPLLSHLHRKDAITLKDTSHVFLTDIVILFSISLRLLLPLSLLLFRCFPLFFPSFSI